MKWNVLIGFVSLLNPSLTYAEALDFPEYMKGCNTFIQDSLKLQKKVGGYLKQTQKMQKEWKQLQDKTSKLSSQKKEKQKKKIQETVQSVLKEANKLSATSQGLFQKEYNACLNLSKWMKPAEESPFVQDSVPKGKEIWKSSQKILVKKELEGLVLHQSLFDLLNLLIQLQQKTAPLVKE